MPQHAGDEAHQAQQVFSSAFGRRASESRLRTVYEVAHNIAKMERHVVDGRERPLCIHRKGATRAFPPGHAEVPAAFRGVRIREAAYAGLAGYALGRPVGYLR